MIFYTADTHFDHENILKICNRPFSTVGEMNEALIANWNRRVTGNDTVFILGDMFYKTKDPEAILARLHGKKKLLIGNHDSQWMGKIPDLNRYFDSIDSYLDISNGEHEVTLCHFPQVIWKHPKTAYMIHGHIHANSDMDYWPLLLARDRALNAGVDINGYQPVTFQELVENNKKFKAEHDMPQRVWIPLSENQGF